MQITRVTLENIKSYRHATVALGRGTTAIRGNNGAGKSTLVEAIGFALFDFLPYPRQQFIREGEKTGKVVVSFVSALDERLYEVERRCNASGGGAWFAIDPELGGRIAEGKDDVVAFLRQHVGIDSNVTLADLFDNAIAVQQGTFTADFLLTPQVRKKKFDTLLQIEDYRKAADTLRETERYLRDAIAEHDRAIERLSTQTADITDWQLERARQHAELLALTEALANIVIERADVEARCSAARTALVEITRLDQERERANGAWQTAQAEAQHAQEDAERTAAAQTSCANNQADYERHLRTVTEHEHAQTEQQAATVLQIAVNRAEQTIAATQAALVAVHERLRAADAAAQERDRLAPLVQRQHEYEEQQTIALQSQQRLIAYEKERSTIARDLAKVQDQQRQINDEIARLDTLAPVAALHPERKHVLETLRAEDATLRERARSRDAIAAQHTRQAQQAEKLHSAAEQAAAQLAEVRALAPIVATLPEHETRFATVARQLAKVQSDIDHATSSMASSQGGMCPFLKESCLNMARRGTSNLEDYFGEQIGHLTDTLMQHEQERDTLTLELIRLRPLHMRYVGLPALEQTAQAAHDHWQTQQAEVVQLADSLEKLVQQSDEATQIAARMIDAERLVIESEQAVTAMAQRPLQAKRLAQCNDAITQATQRLTERDAAIITQRIQAEKIPAIAASLAELSNPRDRYTAYATRAQLRDAILIEQTQHSTTLSTAERDLVTLHERLAPYMGLAERITALQAVIMQTKDAHAVFLRHESEAQRAPQAHDRAARSNVLATTAATAHTVAQAAHAAAIASFDATGYERAQQRISEIDGTLASYQERLSFFRLGIATLDVQIAEAEARLAELHAATAARAESDSTLSLLSYCRDTIKEAGPFVMREWLRRISGEANRIFGEIIGDRAATLSWQDDYDIVLRVGTNERRFAQLSGGEQMTAALSVRLALLRRLTRSTMVIFDEPTQNMDADRRTNLAEQIRRVRDFEQVLVISHDDTFEEGLDAVVRVQKEDGESHIDSDANALSGLHSLILTA